MKSDTLQHTEISFEKLFRTTTLCMWVIDSQRTVVKCNHAALQFLGCSAEEDLQGRPVQEFLPLEDKIYEAALNLRESESFGSMQVTCRDGLVRWIWVDAALHEGMWYITGSDITQQKLAEQEAQRTIEQYRQFTDFAKQGLELYKHGLSRHISDAENMVEHLKASKLKLSKTLETAKLGSWEYSRESRRIELSDEAYGILGITGSNFTLELLADICHPDDWLMLKSGFRNLMRGYSVNMDLRLKINRKIKYYNVQGYPYTLYNEVPMISGTVQDITNRKIQERELMRAKEIAEEATRLKDLFLANISHEIRTPLNSIIGFAELLSKKTEDPHLRRYVDTIRNSGSNLLFIINELLDLSKLQAGALQLEKVDFNINETVSYITNLFKPAVSRGKIEFVTTSDSRLPEHVAGDPYRLAQVLTNLVSNAVKFSQRGKVTLDVKLLKRTGPRIFVQFMVSDTGIGIPKEHLGKIFQNFTQGNTAIARKFGGTGLGLSIVKHLVSLFGGEIAVNSKVGKGTTFTVTLPFLLPEAGPAAPQQPGDTPGIEGALLEGLKILVAEDHEINQLLIQEMFADYSCDLCIAPDGAQAIEMLESEQFDIVLMDLQMPEMDGYEATRAIREGGRPFKNIPIIALTGDAMRGEKEKCLAAGMNDYLSKPFEFRQLVRKISSLTRKK